MKSNIAVLVGAVILSAVSLLMLLNRFDPYVSGLDVKLVFWGSLVVFLIGLGMLLSLLFSRDLTVSLRRGVLLCLIILVTVVFKNIGIFKLNLYYLLIPAGTALLEGWLTFRKNKT